MRDVRRRWHGAAALAAVVILAGGAGLSAAWAAGSKDRTERAWLGVVLSSDKGNVRVLSVVDGSPAETAGLQAGDRIVAVDGRSFDSARGFVDAIRDLRPGDRPEITVDRDGQSLTVRPQLEERSGTFDFHMHMPDLRMHMPDFHLQMPEGMSKETFRRGYLGVHLQPLGEELREYFGAPRDQGILVARVEEDSPAARAGLRVGDVITSIDGQKVAGHGDLLRGLKDLSEGDTVQIVAYRGGQAQTFRVSVEIREHQGWSWSLDCGEGKDCKGMSLLHREGTQGVFRILEDPAWQEQLQEQLRKMEEQLERLLPAREAGGRQA